MAKQSKPELEKTAPGEYNMTDMRVISEEGKALIKKFEGCELIFPKYDYSFDCPNNSLIMMPGWVEHGVSKISIKDSDYFDGYGRYAITSFFGNKDKKETE